MLVPEETRPTAAAIAYGFDKKVDKKGAQNVLVYDPWFLLMGPLSVFVVLHDSRYGGTPTPPPHEGYPHSPPKP